ncbi:hypothetical protein J2129_000219 [Methanofollis sp. W23]|nr:hypothetical protein [Methanofollis sp. W23]
MILILAALSSGLHGRLNLPYHVEADRIVKSKMAEGWHDARLWSAPRTKWMWVRNRSSSDMIFSSCMCGPRGRAQFYKIMIFPSGGVVPRVRMIGAVRWSRISMGRVCLCGGPLTRVLPSRSHPGSHPVLLLHDMARDYWPPARRCEKVMKAPSDLFIGDVGMHFCLGYVAGAGPSGVWPGN